MQNKSCLSAGNGSPPNHYNIWMSALCQLLTTIVADFVSLACDWKYHSIDYFTHWVSNMRTFLTYILIVITLGSSRCVLLQMRSVQSCAGPTADSLSANVTSVSSESYTCGDCAGFVWSFSCFFVQTSRKITECCCTTVTNLVSLVA